MTPWCHCAALGLLLVCTLPSCARSSPPQAGPKTFISKSESGSPSLQASLPRAMSATPAPSAPADSAAASARTQLNTTPATPPSAPGTTPSTSPAASTPSSTSNPGENTAPVPARALPKLELKAVGLHVGGGPNDAATHHAFGAPIALQFSEFMRCYRSVENPKALAIFGVDLLVPSDEGRASVRKIRTSLRGKEFQVCMQGALELVRFKNPLKKPTTVSYSVRFALLGLER